MPHWHAPAVRIVEHLNEHDFLSLQDAQAIVADWRESYNRDRPDNALGWQTLEEFARTFQTNQKFHAPSAA